MFAHLWSNPSLRSFLHTVCQRFCQSSEPCPNPYSLSYCPKDGGERSQGGGWGGVGEDLSLNMDFFTDKTRPNYTSQPFTLHCNKKSIHVAGDHHGSRQNIRLARTPPLFRGPIPFQEVFSLNQRRNRTFVRFLK